MFWQLLGRLSFFGSALEFSSPLGLARWFMLAGVPVGIIALYLMFFE
ncbi:MAG: hypothetical protein JO161_01330 [Planctomycetaceae bacterium]|nr:hypothetical protein [Planctomycetaceae bacterium]